MPYMPAPPSLSVLSSIGGKDDSSWLAALPDERWLFLTSTSLLRTTDWLGCSQNICYDPPFHIDFARVYETWDLGQLWLRLQAAARTWWKHLVCRMYTVGNKRMRSSGLRLLIEFPNEVLASACRAASLHSCMGLEQTKTNQFLSFSGRYSNSRMSIARPLGRERTEKSNSFIILLIM